MSYAEVCKAVETIDRRYCQKDPFRLCKEMGIILLPQQLGNEPDAIKGFFLAIDFDAHILFPRSL